MEEKCFCHVTDKCTGERYQVKDSVARNSILNLEEQVNSISSKCNTYTFTQGVPSSKWEITHNLGKFPSISVIDSAGSVVMGEIDYINQNTITITFSGGFSGTAYLN